jgi:hypothetical protein
VWHFISYIPLFSDELFVGVLLLKLEIMLSVLKDIRMFAFLSKLVILVIIGLIYVNLIHLLFRVLCVVC